MKEVALKKQDELEETCARTYIDILDVNALKNNFLGSH